MTTKILDCTLRDGGYYTNWNFDDNLVRSMVKCLDENGIDIIELGYKSPIKGGPYRKCNDGYIKKVINFETKSKLAFMIDAKDFIDNDQINYGLLDDCIGTKDKSIFSICRIAIKIKEIPQAKEIARYMSDKGYSVIVNLMGISLLRECQIIDFVIEISKIASVIYFADSYGNLTPTNVKKICELYKNVTDMECGIHCHDNLGLAFANSLQAIASGFSYVDTTVCGMGRGVGNTRTEQLMMYLHNDLVPSTLDLIKSFEKLKTKHRWGYNTLYMFAGMNHIHPLFIQDLTNSSLDSAGLAKATVSLKNVSSYNESVLTPLKEQRSVVIIPARYKSSRFPGKPLAKINGKEMILHVAEKAEQAVGKENVYIATENEDISTIVKSAGYHVILTSDSCLTGTDRIAEASLEIDADIIVNVQGDEPMINPEDILRVIECKKNNPNSVVNCMSNLNHDENYEDRKIPKVVCDNNNYLLYASRNALPGSKNGISKNVKKQVCIYAFNKSELMKFHSQKDKSPLEYQEDIEILRFIENGIPVKMLEVNHVSYAVDYPDDISVIERQIVHQFLSPIYKC